jgi:hypothetical protein
VTLIQGPPGTGKSFIGRKIVSTLLDNQDLWRNGKEKTSPIVICLTNKALDQFLDGFIGQKPRFIRMGNQSKSKSNQDSIMSSVCDHIKNFTITDHAAKSAMEDARRSAREMEEQYNQIILSETTEGLLSEYKKKIEAFNCQKAKYEAIICSVSSEWYFLAFQRLHSHCSFECALKWLVCSILTSTMSWPAIGEPKSIHPSLRWAVRMSSS